MAVRKSEVRKLRREFISRKSQVWSRLNKSLVKSLNEIIQVWLKKVEKYTDDVPDLPAMPDKFTKTLNKTLREALAYGYWLNHIYLQELRAAYYKTKYRGKITLADKISDDDKIRASLEKLMSFDNASEWHDVIPEDAIKWLEGYTPSLAGNLHDSVLEKTRDVIRQSMQEGSTLQERMKALREAAPELEAMSKNRIESIARTEITRADSIGMLISNKSNDDVIGYEFSAIMDDRTTDICALRHGLFMKIDDPRLAENTPPCHCNCRSMLLSCTIYDFPDGLNTSHEFDEPEFPSAMQRPEDIEEVKKVLEKPKVEPEIQFNMPTFTVPEEWSTPKVVIETPEPVKPVEPVKPAEPVKPDIPNVTLKPYENTPAGEETIRGVKVSDIQAKRNWHGHIYDMRTMPEDVQRYYSDVGIQITIEEAQEIYRAVYAYTAEGYKTMPSAYLKYQNGLPLTDEEQKLVRQYQLCMEYTKVAPMYKRAGEVYRGIKNSGSEYSQRVLSLKVGDTFTLDRPASFTDEEKQAKRFVADMFAENKSEVSGIIFHVDSKYLKNSTSVMGIAAYAEEQEVLVNDRLFEVIKIDDQRKGMLDESVRRYYEPDNHVHIYLKCKEK